jgi:sugar lactone lactonase YvrE
MIVHPASTKGVNITKSTVIARTSVIAALLLCPITAVPARAVAGLKIPASINFGKVNFLGIGETAPSNPKSVTISNRKDGRAVSALTIQLAGTDPGDFQIASDTCAVDLAAGADCSVTLTFTPIRLGSRAATLTISDSASPDVATVALSGDGVTPKRVPLTLPASVSFGAVEVGQTATQTVAVSNPNSVAVSVQSITTSGAFSQSNTCGTSLAAGGSCQISVTFIPTVSPCNPNGGLETGALSIANDAASGPQQAELSGTAVITAQTAVFVTNAKSNTVTAYPLSGNGNLAPIATIGDPLALSQPYAITVDSSGRIYVANLGTGFDPVPSVSIYAACANGDVTPIGTIGGSKTGLSQPDGIALDARGNIYVANALSGSVTVYRTGSRGNVMPIATIIGAKTKLSGVVGIALDSRGNIYVANGSFGDGAIRIYPPLGSSAGILNEAPIAAITGTNTGLSDPAGIAIDSSGKIYATNQTSESGGALPVADGNVVVFPPLGSSTGSLNESPIVTISAPSSGTDNTGLYYPAAIALDSSGNIYVANVGGGPPVAGPLGPGAGLGSVTVYPPLGSSTGTLNEAPIATIGPPSSGPDNTGLAEPRGIALDSSGDVYVSNSSGGAAFLGSVTVYPPLGSNTDVLDNTPTATIGTSNTELNSPSGIALDPVGNVYVANALDSSITIYEAGGTRDAAPTAAISGDSTGLDYPEGIALDASGNIYVANAGPPSALLVGGEQPFLGSITVYPPLGNSTGILNEAPSATISGDATRLSEPEALALDFNGNIYVANCGDCYFVNKPVPSVTVYTTGSDGNVPPTAMISGTKTGLNYPGGIALDSAGNILVANAAGGSADPKGSRGSVTVYPPLEGSTGVLKAAPISTIAGARTGLVSPFGVALDSSGKIYVTNADASSVTVYPPLRGRTGILDERPIAAITGSDAQFNVPFGIAIGPFVP